MIVLDANILIRAVLGRRVRHLLETYAPCGVRFYAPDNAFAEAGKYLPLLLRNRNLPDADVFGTLQYLKHIVEPLDQDIYGLFREEACLRLRDRDEQDWPVLAAALALSCGIWTEDRDFFGTGVAVWTSDRIEIFLKSQLNPYPPAER